jgi:hypothetical protein
MRKDWGVCLEKERKRRRAGVDEQLFRNEEGVL